MADFYKVVVPIEVPGVKKRWHRIGSATKIDNGIACRLDSIPIDWNGTFYLYPSDSKKDENDK